MITIGLLHCVLEATSMVLNDTYQAMLFRAIFVVLYHGCMQIGECVYTDDKADYALCQNQISFQFDAVGNPISFAISFESFKHSAGRRVPPLLVRAEVDTRYCPVRILYMYHIIRPKNSDY